MGTTKKHFEVFKREVQRWLKFFGLSSWVADIQHYNASDSAHTSIVASGGDILAWAGFADWGNQTVAICLNKQYTGKETLTSNDLSRAALHEVLHVLLRNLTCLGIMRFGVTEELIDTEEHIVLSILENAVWTPK